MSFVQIRILVKINGNEIINVKTIIELLLI